jgi:hypothetical protein
MIEHRYILQPYKGMTSRHRCPGCQHSDKTFSLYIDSQTGESINPIVGRCNRETNCGYHYTPKQYFQDNKGLLQFPAKSYELNAITKSASLKSVLRSCNLLLPKKPLSFIPIDTFKASLKAHETNHFVNYLICLFGVDIASQLVSRYFIGTSKHWDGATVFWQIDLQGKIRTGKIMQYNPTTGKRIKEPYNHISWVHSVLKQPEFELQQCLFGEHLLHDNIKPIAIFESEKTAIIASLYLSQFICLAVGSLSNLSESKCKVLQGRTVTLFPDLNGFSKWNNKAKELTHLANFITSDLLERKAGEAERKQGFDLADYLTRIDYGAFALPEQELIKTENAPTIQSVIEQKPIGPRSYLIKPEKPKPENWNPEIKELENYFEGITIPKEPVKLNHYSSITNVSIFLRSHFATVKANNGKRTFLPFLERLHELKHFLSLNS